MSEYRKDFSGDVLPAQETVDGPVCASHGTKLNESLECDQCNSLLKRLSRFDCTSRR